MRFLSGWFTSSKTFTKKISELEKKISTLEASISKIHAESKAANIPKETTKNGAPTVHIDHLQVDQIVIERLDYANNFGQLGIRELSGKLNIGSTYEGDFSKKIDEIVNKKLGKEARVNFRAKKE